MLSSVELVGLLLVILWLVALSFYFWKLRAQHIVLTDGVSEKTIPAILEDIVRDMKDNKKDIAHLQMRCDKIEKDELLHIQKIGLLRFNPFKDTGGDQSFVLALVDARDTGVIISGLYSRSGTRWYAKKVVDGAGVEYDLSEDEKKALKIAKSANEH